MVVEVVNRGGSASAEVMSMPRRRQAWKEVEAAEGPQLGSRGLDNAMGDDGGIRESVLLGDGGRQTRSAS